MGNWENTEVDLGLLKEGAVVKFTFTSTRPLEISTVQAGCSSCTTIQGYENNKLLIKYEVSSIPKHLSILQDTLETKKDITVVYTDGTSDVLHFKGIIVKK